MGYNWIQNKVIFNFITNSNYSIQRDIATNDTMSIYWNNFEIQCKYFLLLTKHDDGQIVWAYENPFVDQKTKFLSKSLGSPMQNLHTTVQMLNYLKNKFRNNEKIIYNDEEIDLLWCIVGTHKNYRQFYIVTEIKHFINI